jgi:NAD(P)-dependent dehydrogenase (short-subunit alcohol dehydrogenase family)
VDDLRGKVAVVTGAASGIGRAIADRFAAEGMRLVLADVERRVLEQAAAEIAATGAELISLPTDVSSETDVQALAAATFERFGTVHVVCNNAGVGSRGLTIHDLPTQDYEWVFGVNLWGVIHGMRAFLPHLRLHDEGHIVNTASVSGLYHLPRMGPYNASKAAVIALSETLLFELAAEGSHVGVSVVCPSWVRTNISAAVRNIPERLAWELTGEQAAEMAEYKAKRRAQQPDAMDAADVAGQVVDAIRRQRFYVITHPESTDQMRARFDRIVAGENPQPPTV